MPHTALPKSIIARTVLLAAATLCALAILGSTAGCQSQSPAPTADENPAKTASSTKPASEKTKKTQKEKKPKKKEKPAASAGPALTSADIEAIICKGHKHCRTKKTFNAGLDANQQPMQVVEITTDSQITDHLKKDVYYFHENRDITPCEPLEYWFVQPTLIKKGDPKTQLALLTNACGGSDPYTVADPDEVTVEPGLFIFSTGESAAVIHSTTTSIELPSLQIIESTYGRRARTMTDFSSWTWNWRQLAGQHTGFDPHCEYETDEYKNGEYQSSEDDFDTPNFDYQPIIVTPLPAAFRNGGWKTTSLGSCSTSATSLGNKPPALDTGYVTHGKPGTAKDASFKVVMASPTEIYVEVTDSTLVHDAENILHTDHLEIWMRDEFICTKSYKNLFQWGITLDGEVHNFYGKHPKPPTTQTSITQNKNGTHTARFKITIPAQYDGLTVVYSDSEDGKSQKRLIATSAVKYRDQFSIGAVKNIPPERGSCHIKNNKLEYTPKLQKIKSPVI